MLYIAQTQHLESVLICGIEKDGESPLDSQHVTFRRATCSPLQPAIFALSTQLDVLHAEGAVAVQVGLMLTDDTWNLNHATIKSTVAIDAVPEIRDKMPRAVRIWLAASRAVYVVMSRVAPARKRLARQTFSTIIVVRLWALSPVGSCVTCCAVSNRNDASLVLADGDMTIVVADRETRGYLIAAAGEVQPKRTTRAHLPRIDLARARTLVSPRGWGHPEKSPPDAVATTDGEVIVE